MNVSPATATTPSGSRTGRRARGNGNRGQGGSLPPRSSGSQVMGLLEKGRVQAAANCALRESYIVDGTEIVEIVKAACARPDILAGLRQSIVALLNRGTAAAKGKAPLLDQNMRQSILSVLPSDWDTVRAILQPQS